MKRMLFAAVAVIGLGLGMFATTAEAGWGYRPISRWDSACGRYVTVSQRYWVPAPAPVVVAPAPVVCAPPVVAAPVVCTPPVVVAPSVVVTPRVYHAGYHHFENHPYHHHHG